MNNNMITIIMLITVVLLLECNAEFDEILVSSGLKALKGNASSLEIEQWEDNLELARDRNSSPSSKFKSFLGELLCSSVKNFDINSLQLSGTWKLFVNELIDNEKNIEICDTFYDYHKRGSNPKVFQWPMVKWLINYYYILKDQRNYNETWSPVLNAGIYYMKEHIENEMVDNTVIRLERVQHVFHFFVLEKAIGVLPSHFSQVVEFGGGTGEIETLLRQAKFSGTHFVVDIPPMLFMQQYFLQYSYWPCYLGHTIDQVNGRKMLLESSQTLKSSFYNHLNRSEMHSTLFMATWSLSEAPISDRIEFVNNFHTYGIILIAFKHEFDTINNLKYFLGIAKELESKFSQCIWEVPLFPKNYYYVAYRKGHQPRKVICSPVTGCNKHTYVYGDCIPTNDIVNFHIITNNKSDMKSLFVHDKVNMMYTVVAFITIIILLRMAFQKVKKQFGRRL